MFVELIRGNIVESRHRVHVAVVNAAGHFVAGAGDPDLVTFMRSAAKPFQALPLVEDGVVERFGLTGEDLALACASHSSEPEQVERVRAFLARVGAGEDQLRCGPHTPLSEQVARDYAARGTTLGPVHSNCSGKHAGMLALARHHGWPTEGYTRPDHSVQRRCLSEVSRWTAVPEAKIGVGTDGCGVVTFAISVRSMAIGYATLGKGERGRGKGGDASPIPHPASPIPHPASPIVEAMLAHPDLIAGRGRPCTELMTANPGTLVTKVGAEGVYASLLVDRGLGVALKVEDGHGPSAALAMAAVLGELGLAVPERLGPVGALRINGGLSHKKDEG